MIMNISGLGSQIASEMFTKIDTKNQGYIDKTTFASAVGGDDASGAEEAFKALDSDSDGQLTKSELTKGIENLLSQLNSASVQGQGDANRPPPPDGGQEDAGLTKDEMTKMASETKDSKLSGMLSNVASNFEAADTNQDGKVTQQEAMAYERSKSESSSSGSATTESRGSSTKNEAAMKKVAELLSNYLSQMGDSSTTTSTTSSISVTA
jgi:Ca2+-binding EF-hand superfamily protein